MKQNLYATAVTANIGDATRVLAGYYGATSILEAEGKAVKETLDENKGAAITCVVAIVVPLEDLKKIIAQHETP